MCPFPLSGSNALLSSVHNEGPEQRGKPSVYGGLCECTAGAPESPGSIKSEPSADFHREGL